MNHATAGVEIAPVEDEPLPSVYVCDTVRLLYVSMSDKGGNQLSVTRGG